MPKYIRDILRQRSRISTTDIRFVGVRDPEQSDTPPAPAARASPGGDGTGLSTRSKQLSTGCSQVPVTSVSPAVARGPTSAPAESWKTRLRIAIRNACS